MRWVLLVAVVGCGSSQAAPDPNDPFAKPPPGAPAPKPTTLPMTGPECTTGCPVAPLYPTQGCSDRIHTGGRGPCVRFKNGCNWSGLVCPDPTAGPACKPTDCELPIPAEWLCPDRKTVARFSCVRAKGGRCGATYEACPASAMRPPPPPPPPPPPKPTPCPDPLPSDSVLKTWPIGEICQGGGGPVQPERKFLRGLPDGTSIIEQLGRCVRVRQVKCYTKCLPPDTRIATPTGDVAASDIRIGTIVWTRDSAGRRVAAAVENVSSPRFDGVHHVARLRLADGRVLVASPEHPVLGGRLQDLHVGDRYDGSAIVGLAFEEFRGDHTVDLLPAGDTGIYWADGIPVESTLLERTDSR